MCKKNLLQLILNLSLVVYLLSMPVCAEQLITESLEWPRVFINDADQIIVHQPYVNEWDFKTIKTQSAVVVKSPKEDNIYGTMNLKASTIVDHSTRLVKLTDIVISNIQFNNLSQDKSSNIEQLLKATIPAKKKMWVSLDRLLALTTPQSDKVIQIKVNLEPPPIFTTTKPSVLINFMGEPDLKSIPETKSLLFAKNTNWDILFDIKTSMYYLLVNDGWLASYDLLKGKWQRPEQLPASFKQLPDNDNWKSVKKNIPGRRLKSLPQIFTSTQPAELIVFEGAPSFTPISGTKLMYSNNTESYVFLNTRDEFFYVLIAGRWFKSSTLTPKDMSKKIWQAASDSLPDEFKKIPNSHKKASVLSSVPGTTEADTAILQATLPKKAVVKREETTVSVVYEGKPNFIEIKNTSSKLYYAINTPLSIFKVDSSYYCVKDGIWFVATSSNGPWIVASKIPEAIYSIPSDHPKHHVTYVYIYGSTPDTVVVGYTSGYSGTYVATTGVVMFGLGYLIGHDDHHHHGYHYDSHYYSYGGHAHYSHYRGGYYSSAQYHGPYGGLHAQAGYNPATGTYYRGGYAHGPYGGSAFTGSAYNPYTERYGARAGASTPYGSWGRSVVANEDGDWARGGHRSDDTRTVAAFETSKGQKGIAGYNKRTGQGGIVTKGKDGDLYAGKNGKVYKKENDAWKVNSGDGWKNFDKSSIDTANYTNKNRSNTQTANKNSFKNRSSTQMTNKDSFKNRSRSQTTRSDSIQTLNRQSQRRELGNRMSGNRMSGSRSSRSGGFRSRR